jgi:hypothetical protein
MPSVEKVLRTSVFRFPRKVRRALERVDLRGSSKYFPRGTSVPVRSIVTSKLDCSNGSLTYPTVEYSTVGTVRTIISYFPAV